MQLSKLAMSFFFFFFKATIEGKKNKNVISLKKAWYSCQRHCSLKGRCSSRRSHPFCLYHCGIAAGKHQSPRAMHSHKITAWGRVHWGKAETKSLEQHRGKGLPDLLEPWPVSYCPLLSLPTVSLNSKHCGGSSHQEDKIRLGNTVSLQVGTKAWCLTNQESDEREKDSPHTLSDHCPEALALLFPPYPLLAVSCCCYSLKIDITECPGIHLPQESKQSMSRSARSCRSIFRAPDSYCEYY